MKDQNKTRSQLINELQEMRKRVADLEQNSTEEKHEKVVGEALRESEERLRLALDASNDGIWDWNPGTGQTYFSQRYYTMLGYEPDEFSPTYDNWRRLIHPGDVDAAEAAVQRALKEHTPFAIEFRMKAKNGAWLWILGRGKIVELDAERKAVRVVGSHTDITEHKRTAEALEKRLVALTRPLEDVEGLAFEDLFNMDDIQLLQDRFAEATGVASLITRTDGTPITRPTNFCRLCMDIIRKTEKGRFNCQQSDAEVGRLSGEGLVFIPCKGVGLWDACAKISVGGKHIANWGIGQIRNETQKEEEVMAYAREIGADEKAFRAAYREVTIMSQEQFEKVGRVLFELTHQLSTTAYQNVQQARFITEKKRAEEELRRLRNYLSNIIDSMPSILVAADREGRVTQWNRQAEQTTGLSFKDAQAQPLAKVFPRLSDEMERIGAAIRDRRVIKSPKVSRKVDNEIRFEDVTIFPLMANGVEGAVIRLDDVTQQVRLEEMMIQSEKMLSVGGLAAGMAHEINNPLAGIVQSVAVLENRLLSGLPANHQAADTAGTTLTAIQSYATLRKLPDLIGNIRESGSRAAAIVRNMLSFARKSEKVVSNHDLSVLLDQTLDLLKTDYDMKKHYDFKQIRVEREYDPAASPVPCEASKIQQVFMNILKNGAEAMAGITNDHFAPAFVLRVQADSDGVRVEIEDNGPGMDEETRQRIFEPFFTTKPVGKGTGLGLSVSYFIITEDHGGQMSVHAAEGGGT